MISQFFIAYYDDNGSYVDDITEVAKRYGLSITSFWFDLATSLPWSYLDLYVYQVNFDGRMVDCLDQLNLENE